MQAREKKDNDCKKSLIISLLFRKIAKKKHCSGKSPLNVVMINVFIYLFVFSVASHLACVCYNRFRYHPNTVIVCLIVFNDFQEIL